MKQLLSILVISIGFFSCTSQNAGREKENLEVAKRYMKAVENLNTAAMDSLLAENYMGYGPSVGDSTNKKDAIATFKNNVENLYQSFQYTRHKELAVTVREGEAQGDWVLNWAYLTIKYKDGRGPIN